MDKETCNINFCVLYKHGQYLAYQGSLVGGQEWLVSDL